MNIRQAKLNDYDQLIPLLNGFVGEDRYSKKDFDSFETVITSQNNHLFVAEEQNVLVGFVTFSVRYVIRYPRPIAELDELFVNNSQRKKGIGKALLQQVIKTAQKKDCYRLYIESHYQHKVAHKLYEASGFENYGYHFYIKL
ncbi:GNAT family N-acetyltransferase [Patescibacteria group bacterium]